VIAFVPFDDELTLPSLHLRIVDRDPAFDGEAQGTLFEVGLP